jgi:hypothetical protein
MAPKTATSCPDLVSYEGAPWMVADAKTVGGKRYLRIEPVEGRGSRIVPADEVEVIK